MKLQYPETEKKDIAFNKIVKCILSCKTIDQCESCLNMIHNFSNIFKKIQYIHCSIETLLDELKIKKNVINGKK